MEEKPGKDFMIIHLIKNKALALLFLALVLTLGCQPDLSDDPIPHIVFEPITIDMSLPKYFALQSDGAALELNEGGVRGIIVYRENASTFRAFEKNCTYQPNSACATVNVDASTFFMIDPCCSSTFNFEGDPQSGPASRPLRQYLIERTGSALTITDETVN